MTKNLVDVDLLITGNTRKACKKQAQANVKVLFSKDGGYVKPIGEVRHIVKDYKANGHHLYMVPEEFCYEYRKLSSGGR